MAGQSANLPLSKAKSQAEAAGKVLGESGSSGSKATAPTKGCELGNHKKASHNY